MILFLFDRYLSLDYYALERKFFEYQFLRKCAFFASRLWTFRSALGLRVNDVGKICPSSMLCRWTWWTTFAPGLTSDSHSYELQNFLKCNGQIQHNAFLYIIFKNSYLPMCAHSRISSGTKVDQLEELYKISWKIPTLTHTTLVNTVRVYRVTTDNFFLSK